MKSISVKYLAAFLLVSLFTLKWLLTVLPFFEIYSDAFNRGEMQMNGGQESTKENSSEKIFDLKEFIGHYFDGDATSIKYAVIPKLPATCNSGLLLEVFFPIHIPPPKTII